MQADAGEDPTVVYAGSRSRTVRLEDSIGRRLGKYMVTGILGVGGMGVVFRAVDGDLEREVALKVLAPEHQDGGEITRQESGRLLREARAQAQLSHPNVVVVYDVGSEQGEVYLAMELIEGPSLREWLDAGARGWHEVLAVFLAAGAGLAAAHVAGLVHRDFKPANVLLGHDGRPRVSDFGLARPTRELSRALGSGSGDSAAIDDEALTVAGTVVGTPAYMAPEQHAGQPLTAAVDQYAFCMALWEALAGQHPLRGMALREVLAAKLRGPPVPPAGLEVPQRVWQVLARGLAPAPADRFASMSVLLDALRRAGSSRRPWWVGAAVASVVLVASVAALLPSDPSPCRIDEAALAGRWDPAARAEVQRAFEATGRSYAVEASERVAGSLDEFGAAWLDQRRAACEATRVRGEQDEATLDRRVACLDEAGDALGRVVEVLRQADAATVDRTAAVLASLPDPSRCEDAESLAARPLDPDREAEAQALSAELVGVQARVSAGRFAEALALADELRPRVEPLDWAPVSAKHAGMHAKALEGLARHVEAHESFQRALAAAREAGDDRFAAQVALWLAWNVGVYGSRAREGLDWVRTAEASLARIGDDPVLQAEVLNTRGVLETDLGNDEAARRALAEAIAVEERLGHEEQRLAGLLVNLAILEGQRGEHRVAEGMQRRALAIRERVQGRDHPETATVLNNLANTLMVLNRDDEAIAANEEALARIGRTYGLDHPLVATFRVARAGLLNERGERGPAAEELRAAVAVYEATLGPEHRDLVIIHNNLGQILLEDGQAEPARRAFERALAAAEANDLYERPAAMPALVGLARALTELKQDELARRRWDEALGRIDAGQGEALDELPVAFRSAAEVYARTGDPERAAALRAKADASSEAERAADSIP